MKKLIAISLLSLPSLMAQTSVFVTTHTGAAIASAITTAGAGGTVELSCGTYTYTSTLVLLTGQTLRAVSPGCAIVSKGANGFALDINTLSDVLVQGITFEGNYNQAGNTGYTGSGIWVRGSTRVMIRDNKFLNHELGAIVMEDTSYVTVSDNYLEGNSGDNVSGTPSIFDKNNTSYHRIHGNKIKMRSGGSHGIGYHTETHGKTQHDNIIDHNEIINDGGGYCIEVGSFASGGDETDRPNNVSVDGNTCYMTATGSGGYSFDWVSNSTVINNKYQLVGGTAGYAFESVNGRNVTISNNTVNGGDATSIGIGLDHDMRGGVVANNNIKGILTTAQGKAIAIRSDPNYCVGGTTCTVSDNTIIGNEIEFTSGADSSGIVLKLDSADIGLNNRIMNNSINWLGTGSGNSTGIGLSSGANNPNVSGTIVTGNYIRNLRWGIYVDSLLTDKSMIAWNTFDSDTTNIQQDIPLDPIGQRIHNSLNTGVVLGAATHVAGIAHYYNQAAAIGATTLFTPNQTSLYRVSFTAKVTRGSSSTSNLGQFGILWDDGSDSVSQTAFISPSAAETGTVPFTGFGSNTNSTQAISHGSALIYAEAGTPVRYTYGYASTGGTTMQYELHVVAEKIQ